MKFRIFGNHHFEIPYDPCCCFFVGGAGGVIFFRNHKFWYRVFFDVCKGNILEIHILNLKMEVDGS